MARVKSPLLSIDARGSLGNAITYQKWRSLRVARGKSEPSKKCSAAQRRQRSFFSGAAEQYHLPEFTAVDVKSWKIYGNRGRVRRSSYNAFVKHYEQVKKRGQDFVLFTFRAAEPE